MKNQLKKTVPLFGILILTSLTASGQFTTHNNDSIIPYTQKQDKRCLECLINSPKKDSLISNLHQIIYIAELEMKTKTAQNAILSDSNKLLQENNTKLSHKLFKARKWLKINFSLGLGAGIFTAYLLK